jgi:uncharacterized protein
MLAVRDIRTAGRFGILVLGLWVTGAASSVSAQDNLTIPEVPANFNFVQDYASLLSPQVKTEIGAIQKQSFEQNQKPIIVVTIDSMARYGATGYSIERFATAWFNKWQVGAKGSQGELINKGILLLVSVGDRKARIELGNDWGQDWDLHAAKIMNQSIIPQFKQKDFPAGILAGVKGLSEMTLNDPKSAAPSTGSGGSGVSSGGGAVLPTSPLNVWQFTLVLVLGIALIVASFFFPDQRKWLLIVGGGLVALATLAYLVLILVAIFAAAKSKSALGGGGGFSSSDGFDSGGFSGGGGASGEW